MNDLNSNIDVTTTPVTVSVDENKSCFSGKFSEATLGMYIKKVIYNDPATIVLWSDGTRTVSKVQEGDVYSKETGLLLCVLKKLVGTDKVMKLIGDWVVPDMNFVDIKTVRHNSKTKQKKSMTDITKNVTEHEDTVIKTKSKK